MNLSKTFGSPGWRSRIASVSRRRPSRHRVKQYGFSALMVLVLIAAAFSRGPTRALLYLIAGSIGFEWLSRHWIVSRLVRICAYALIAIALVTSGAHVAFSGIYLTATATELGWLFIAIRHHRRWRHADFTNSPTSSAL